MSATATHSKVIKIVGPIFQLFITATCVVHSSVTNKLALWDTYKSKLLPFWVANVTLIYQCFIWVRVLTNQCYLYSNSHVWRSELNRI